MELVAQHTRSSSSIFSPGGRLIILVKAKGRGVLYTASTLKLSRVKKGFEPTKVQETPHRLQSRHSIDQTRRRINLCSLHGQLLTSLGRPTSLTGEFEVAVTLPHGTSLKKTTKKRAAPARSPRSSPDFFA